jgi:phenylacetate-CoA ligase
MNITPLERWISGKINTVGSNGRPDEQRLRAYQLHKLRETLRHATANGRYYKERLRNVDPDSIRDMEHVATLPFTYPADLRQHPTDFLCVSPREVSRIVSLSTSGTTGQPKKIFFTKEDQELTVDFFHHGMTTLTVSNDRVMIFMPGSTEGSVGDLLKKGLARFGCEAIVYGPIQDYRHALRALLEEKITCIVGIPLQVLTLSRTNGEGAVQPDIKSVLLSTDYVPKALSDSLEAVWGCKAFNHYGMTEMGLGGGVECQALCGYHTRDADLLFEIVDPRTGMPVPDGEYGEVVFSTLTRRGMPLIRYRTGDRSRFLTGPCPCGTVLKRMDHVTGRITEAVRLSDGRTLSITQLDEVLFRDKSIISYSAEITKKNGLDCLVLTVKAADLTYDPERLSALLTKDAAIDDLTANGLLQLDIRKGEPDYFTTGTSKRFIADRRLL